MSISCGGPRPYRVWIVRYCNWQPAGPEDLPPESVAIEPAERGVFPASEAARYTLAFNRAAMLRGQKLWAVAVPVAVRYEGDPRPGEKICPARACTHKDRSASEGKQPQV